MGVLRMLFCVLCVCFKFFYQNCVFGPFWCVICIRSGIFLLFGVHVPYLFRRGLASGPRGSSTFLWPGSAVMNVASCATPFLTFNPLESICRYSSSHIFWSLPVSFNRSLKAQTVERSGIISGNPKNF